MGRRRINLEGQKFNKLLCLEYVKTDKRGNARYLWKCDCGKTKEIDGSKVKNGYTKGCGCLIGELNRRGRHRLDYGEASFRAYYKEYEYSAKRRGREFSLTVEEFKELTQQLCYYCNTKPEYEHKRNQGFNGSYKGNGVDRVDNNRGYVKENCVSCCKICNIMKQSLEETEFLDKIRSIYVNFFMDK